MRTGSKSTWTCARATRCASSRRPTTSRCPSAARSRSSMHEPPEEDRRTRSSRPSGPVPPKHCPSEKRKTDNAVTPPRATGGVGRAVAAGQPRRRDGGRLDAAGRLLHRGRHLRLEHRPEGRRHVRRHRRDPRHRAWPGDGGPGGTGSTRTRRCSSTTSTARSSASGSRSPTRPTSTTQRSRSTASAAAGSGLPRWTGPARSSGSATSSTSAMSRTLFMELIKAGELSPGMQKRIERGMAGEKLPGYYPLGKAPVADLVAPGQAVAWGCCDVAN